MEILLVLAVLVALGAMVYPALERPFAAERLRRAGDQVRAHWIKARNQATNSGEVYSFRCQLEGSRYLIERYAELDVQTTQSTGYGVNATQSSTATTAALQIEKSLPPGITVSNLQVEEDARTTQQAMDVGVQDPSQSRDETWSTHVLFFPDGTTTTTELTLTNEYGATILVQLRGITGVSRLGETTAADDSPAPGAKR
jgi:Tfp pilus assembly protein FimT